jgi:hypothetical protein
MQLLRKISVAKWKASLQVGPEFLSADAITGCLRTTGNTLSVWKFNTDEEAQKSLLALGSSLTRIETISYIILDVAELEKDALRLVDSEGQTAAVGSNQLHRDIVDLDHAGLEKVAIHVKRKVQLDDFKTLTKGDLKKMLIEGIKSGTLDAERLDKKLLQDIQKPPPAR